MPKVNKLSPPEALPGTSLFPQHRRWDCRKAMIEALRSRDERERAEFYLGMANAYNRIMYDCRDPMAPCYAERIEKITKLVRQRPCYLSIANVNCFANRGFYLSDLDGPFPAAEPQGIPVIWAATRSVAGERTRAPVGCSSGGNGADGGCGTESVRKRGDAMIHRCTSCGCEIHPKHGYCGCFSSTADARDKKRDRATRRNLGTLPGRAAVAYYLELAGWYRLQTMGRCTFNVADLRLCATRMVACARGQRLGAEYRRIPR